MVNSQFTYTQISNPQSFNLIEMGGQSSSLGVLASPLALSNVKIDATEINITTNKGYKVKGGTFGFQTFENFSGTGVTAVFSTPTYSGTGQTTFTLPNSSSWTKKADFTDLYKLPVVELSTASDNFISLQYQKMIFTIYNDSLMEEYTDMNTWITEKYYRNGTIATVAQDGSLRVDYPDGSFMTGSNCDSQKTYLLRVLQSSDDLETNLIKKLNGGTLKDYNYDGSLRTTTTQYTFTNGTVTELFPTYKQVKDNGKTLKFYTSGQYDHVIDTPATADVYKSQNYAEFTTSMVFQNLTSVETANNGKVTITETGSTTVWDFDFNQLITTTSTKNIDTISQIETIVSGGATSYKFFNGTTLVMSTNAGGNVETYTTSSFTQTKSSDSEVMAYTGAVRTLSIASGDITITFSSSKQPQSLLVQTNKVTLTVSATLSYLVNLDEANQVMTVTKSGIITNLNGTYTNNGITKKLYVDKFTYALVTADSVVINADGIYRKIGLSEPDYFENEQKEFGSGWIKKSTGEEAQIWDGKFFYSNFVYDMVTQKRFIKDTNNSKFVIQNDDYTGQVKDKKEVLFTDLNISNAFDKQQVAHKVNYKGELNYLKGTHQTTYQYLGNKKVKNTSNNYHETLDLINSVTWNTKNTYPRISAWKFNQIRYESSLTNNMVLYFHPYNFRWSLYDLTLDATGATVKQSFGEQSDLSYYADDTAKTFGFGNRVSKNYQYMDSTLTTKAKTTTGTYNYLNYKYTLSTDANNYFYKSHQLLKIGTHDFKNYIDGQGDIFNTGTTVIAGSISAKRTRSIVTGSSIAKTNPMLFMTQALDTAANTETHTYQNGVTVSVDSTKTQYTYTYPAKWPWSQFNKSISELVVKKISTTDKEIIFTMITGDSVTLTISSGIPASVNGAAWVSANQRFSLTLTTNGVTKDISMAINNDDVTIEYNSYKDANPENKKFHIRIYSMNPELTEYLTDTDDFLTHQFLNTSAYQIDKRVPTNTTNAWYTNVNVKKIIGKDFVVDETATQQYTVFSNGETKLWDYSAKTVTIENSLYTLTQKLNDQNKITEQTYAYKTAGLDPNNKKETINLTTQLVDEVFQTYTNSTTKNFVSSTDTTTWTYPNTSTFVQSPTDLSGYAGQYNYHLQVDATNSYKKLPNGELQVKNASSLVKINSDGTTRVEQTYDLNNLLLYTKTYYLLPTSQYDYQNIMNLGNITYYYRNGDVKHENIKNSYYIVYSDKYLPIYTKYEYFFQNSETSAPTGYVIGKVIQENNLTPQDKKTINSATSYDYLYGNGTLKEVTLSGTNIVQEKFTYLDSQLTKWKTQTYDYFTDGKLNQITSIDRNLYMHKDFYFATPSDTVGRRKTEITFPSETTQPLQNAKITYDWTDETRMIDYTINGYNNTSTKVNPQCFQTMHNPNSTVLYQTIDVNRMSDITFTNGTSVRVNLTQFILTGCWYDTEHCIRQKCYSSKKCFCEKNKYCVWNVGTSTHSCQAISHCDDCAALGKWCQRKTHEGSYYYTCIDEPQDSEAPTTGCSPGCGANEVCISGTCDFKGTPCYFDTDNSFIGVFCSKNQKCYNSKCYPDCQPECELNENCIFSQSKDAFECVEKTIYPQTIATQECRLIQNCGTSSLLGECEFCEENYSFLRTNDVISYITCVQTNDVNCLVGKSDISNPGSYVCDDYSDRPNSMLFISEQKGCKRGHQLQAGVCKLDPEGCKEFNEYNQCRYCTNEYELNENKELNYSINGPFKQGECIDKPQSFDLLLPQINQNEKEQVFNCKFFQLYFHAMPSTQPLHDLRGGINRCHECQDDYFLNFEYYCLKKLIPNCEIFDTSVTWGNRATQKCLTCVFGMIPVKDANNKIIECKINTPEEAFRIPECQFYDENFDCLGCNPGFVLRKTAKNHLQQSNFCFQQTKYTFCNTMDEEYFKLTGKVKCKSCDKIKYKFSYPRALTEQVEKINTCVYISKRNNCFSHQVGEINDSNLICKQCDQLYYLKKVYQDPLNFLGNYTENCFPRVNIYSNCEIYKIDEDDCQKFQTTFEASTQFQLQLSGDIEILIKSPPPEQLEIQKEVISNWILGCDVYQDSNDCAKCYAHKYRFLEGFEYNLKCLDVSRVISNCRYYDNSQKCTECFPFYILREGNCYLRRVENCKVFKDESKCLVCEPLYPFMDEDGNCTKHPLNPWCLIYTIPVGEIFIDQQLDCETCLEDYYPDDDSFCRLRSKTITNCKYYLGENLCKECHDGYYLTYDGKNCYNNPVFDQNCHTFNYVTKCSVCQFGYYLKNGLCQKCVTDKTQCAFCDPEFPENCLMCFFGYHVNSTGGCVKNQAANFKGISRFTFFSDSKVKATPGTQQVIAASMKVLLVSVMIILSLFQ